MSDPDELTRALSEMPTWDVDDASFEEPEPSGESEPPPPEPESPRSMTPPPGAQPPPMIRILEALLFLGDAPLTESRACGTIRGLTASDFHSAIRSLSRVYREQGRPYFIKLQNDGYVLELRSRFAGIRERMRGGPKEAKLSSAAVQVLALVAYRQPVEAQEIDSLRGDSSISLLRQLLRHGVIALQREVNKEPMYVTTPGFLKMFQLRNLDDLPRTMEIRQL